MDELREQNRILRENGMKAETRAIKAEADADELKKGNKKILNKLTNLQTDHKRVLRQLRIGNRHLNRMGKMMRKNHKTIVDVINEGKQVERV